VPFQCRIRVSVPPLVNRKPTAQAFVAEVAATPLSSPLPTGFGLRTCFQEVPFQRSIRVAFPVDSLKVDPTAQAFAAEVAATPSRKAPRAPAGNGLRICFQAVPSQCRIRDGTEKPSAPL
jgi:hypothetical protein